MQAPFESPEDTSFRKKVFSSLTFNVAKNKADLFIGLAFVTLFVLVPYYLYMATDANEVDARNKTQLPVLQYFNSTQSFDESYNSYLTELGLHGNAEYVDLTQPLPPVTFITAFSENHAAEGRALLTRFANDHPDWKVYIYDMGMRNNTRKSFEKACNVAEVRDIDLAHFGVHENLFTYRWKPIIIATVLKEFPVVFWLDTSTFFAGNMTIDDFMDRVNVTDYEGPHVYVFEATRHSNYAVTSPGMFDYLAPQGDIYSKQYHANKQLYVRTKATYELVLKWYVLCALEGSCMAPEGHELYCHFNQKDKIYTYANCHRYDQSAISIILSPYPRNYMGGWAADFLWTQREITATKKELAEACKAT